MFELKAYLEATRQTINAQLEQLLKKSKANSRIEEAMRYSLFAGGKRLRPILCIAAAEAVGEVLPKVMRAAAAIEMIHTYSLIHDDLPAMDDDDLRRGHPTCHIAYDQATAILAGDALLTYAFHILTGDNADSLQQLKIIKKISHAVGHQGMIQGQMLDIAAEGQVLTIEDLENIHQLKTGALINASIFTGALLGSGTVEEVNHLNLYATKIGLAFQVTDDILNIEGDPKVLGKAVGTDFDRHKATYPAILGLQRSKELARELVHSALQTLSNFDNRADPLRAIASYITERKR